MVKAAYVDKNGVRKGAWSREEDEKLRDYIVRYGHWNWRLLPKFAGLERCGKSCRLRWMNYLKPGVRRGNYTKEERDLIYRLHRQLGNKWSAIAAKFPGRSDNDIKNYWNTHHRKSNTGRKVGQHAEIQQSLEVVDCKNILEDSFADSVDPKLSRRKLGKAKVSSDIFILESSSSCLSSSEASSAVDSDSTAENFHEMLLYDDLFSDFHENFWTQPFMVDTYSYNCGYNFPLFDDDAK